VHDLCQSSGFSSIGLISSNKLIDSRCRTKKQELSSSGRDRHAPKSGELLPFSGGARSPSNTTWPGPRPTCTSTPSGVLIHSTDQRHRQDRTDIQRCDSIGRTVAQKLNKIAQVYAEPWACCSCMTNSNLLHDPVLYSNRSRVRTGSHDARRIGNCCRP